MKKYVIQHVEYVLYGYTKFVYPMKSLLVHCFVKYRLLNTCFHKDIWKYLIIQIQTCVHTWRSFLKNWRRIGENLLMFCIIRLHVFRLCLTSYIKWNYYIKYKNSLHKFHRYVSAWMSILPCEPSSLQKGSPSFTKRRRWWNLWRFVNVLKLHAENLWINELSVCETCEGCFCTLLKIKSGCVTRTSTFLMYLPLYILS